MSLEAFMIDALQRATEMVRTEGVVRPTFVIASAEGVYTLVCRTERTLHAEEHDEALNVVSALLRWSMTRAFVVACEHESPNHIAVYVVTADEAEGFAVRLRRRPLRFDDIEVVAPPPSIRRLRALIPPPISRLTESEVLDLEEAFGMDLEACRPYYVS